MDTFGLEQLFSTMSNVNVIREGDNVDPPERPTIERDVPQGAQRVGVRNARRTAGRLFPYDRLQGVRNATLQFSVTKSDRMSETSAAHTLQRLHSAYGLVHLFEEQFYDFDEALWICYSLNGASQLLPADRVTFSANGSVYDYRTVYELLGVDSRRFFRAYANVIVDACRNLYTSYDPHNDDQAYAREMMVQLAAERGLTRAPWLIADCADKATNLDSSEDILVQNSKRMVIGATPNAVDRRTVGAPIRSLDNYDSTNLRSVPNTVDISTEPQYYS